MKYLLFIIVLIFTPVIPAIAEEPQYVDAVTAYRRAGYDTAFRTAFALAKNGNTKAQSMLGSLYAYGRGTQKADKEAVRWFTEAAQSGETTAQGALGSMYLQGRGGLEANPELAALWFQKAAEQNDVFSQYFLSEMYANGIGASKNPEKASK